MKGRLNIMEKIQTAQTAQEIIDTCDEKLTKEEIKAIEVLADEEIAKETEEIVSKIKVK